jgi:hypothetical protein
VVQTREFKKENGIWYINLNVGEGDIMQKIPLRKGADAGLDIMANGGSLIRISYDTKEFEGAALLELVKPRPREDGGGGYYFLKIYKDTEVNLDLVLNHTIEYVFGKVPEKIWFRKEDQQ